MEWFMSDTHFGHEAILRAHNRPFKSVEEMDEAMLSSINRLVKKTDTLYHLGDFASCHVEKAIKYRKRINCENLFLIYGNHDYKNRSFKEFRKVFGKGHCHDILEIRRESHLMVMHHYPHLFWHHWDKAAFNLHGHMHCESSPLREHHMQLDVAVDGHDFRPWSFDEVMEYMKPRHAKYRELQQTVGVTEKTWFNQQ